MNTVGKSLSENTLGFLSLYTPQEASELQISKPGSSQGLIRSWQDLTTFVANPGPQVVLSNPKLSSPRTITFYSYKGGVGRTTALTHVAWILAQSGRKVVALDLDLEAPGLSTAFNLTPEPIYGLVDYFECGSFQAMSRGPKKRSGTSNLLA